MKQKIDWARRMLTTYRNSDTPWDDSLTLLLAGCLRQWSAGNSAFGELLTGFLPAVELQVERYLTGRQRPGDHGTLGAGILLTRLGESLGEQRALDLAASLHSHMLALPRKGQIFAFSASGEILNKTAFFTAYPFYAVYETQYNGKEQYNDLFSQLRLLHKLSTPQTRGISTGLPEALYPAALLAVWEASDEEAYEFHRAARDLFQQALKDILAARGELYIESGSAPTPTDLVLAHCVLSGVRHNLLLADRYLPTIRPVLDRVALDPAGLGPNSNVVCLAAALLLLAEMNQ